MSLRQIVVLRGDLLQLPRWSLGSIIAQACHASNQCLLAFKHDPNVLEYTNSSNVARMTTVILKVKDEACLSEIEDLLKRDKLDFTTWIEIPENIKTAVALKPYPKSELPIYIQHLGLYK